jgi:ankyrin repeat protein
MIRIIVLALIPQHIFSLQSDTLLRVLHKRESGVCPDFKKQISIIRLKAINDTANFKDAFPEELLPQEGDSFEHNSLMEIVPTALANKDTDFKNAFLATILDKFLPPQTDLYWIIALVKSGANPNLKVNSSPVSYNPPIALIYRHPNYAYAHALIERGADPHLQINKHDTFTAINSAHSVELVELLRSHGVNIDYIGPFTGSFLHNAACQPLAQPELIDYFIKNGLDVNAQTAVDLNTPLHCLLEAANQYSPTYGSSEESFKEKLHYLLTEDIDLSKQDRRGRDLETAAEYHTQHCKWFKAAETIKRHKVYQEEAVRMRAILID